MTRVINTTMATTAIASNTPSATVGPSIVNGAGTERNWIIHV